MQLKKSECMSVCLCVCGELVILTVYNLLKHKGCSRISQNVCRMFQNVPEWFRMYAECMQNVLKCMQNA